MADISKCTGENCPFKEKCYRFTAPSSHYQSFFSMPPIYDKDAEPDLCEMFLDNEEYENETDDSN